MEEVKNQNLGNNKETRTMEKEGLDSVQNWISLKKYETPGEEYFDHFLSEFHKHQREELLKRSTFQVLWERFSISMANIVQSRWTYASCAAALTLGFVLTVVSQSPKEETRVVTNLVITEQKNAEIISISNDRFVDSMPHMQSLDFNSPSAPVKVQHHQVF